MLNHCILRALNGRRTKSQLPNFPRADVKQLHRGSPGARCSGEVPCPRETPGAHHHLAAPSGPRVRTFTLRPPGGQALGDAGGWLPGPLVGEAWPPGPGRRAAGVGAPPALHTRARQPQTQPPAPARLLGG